VTQQRTWKRDLYNHVAYFKTSYS